MSLQNLSSLCNRFISIRFRSLSLSSISKSPASCFSSFVITPSPFRIPSQRFDTSRFASQTPCLDLFLSFPQIHLSRESRRQQHTQPPMSFAYLVQALKQSLKEALKHPESHDLSTITSLTSYFLKAVQPRSQDELECLKDKEFRELVIATVSNKELVARDSFVVRLAELLFWDGSVPSTQTQTHNILILEVLCQWMTGGSLSNSSLQVHCCATLANIARYNAYYQVKVVEEGFLPVLKNVMITHFHDSVVQQHACGVLRTIATNVNNQVVEQGFLTVLKNVMTTHCHDTIVQQHACATLMNISANNDSGQIKVTEEGFLPVLKNVMVTHCRDAAVQPLACGLLMFIAGRMGDETKVVEDGFLPVLKNVMVTHCDDIDVQRSACAALWIIVYYKNNRVKVVEEGFSKVLSKIARQHTSLTKISEDILEKLSS